MEGFDRRGELELPLSATIVLRKSGNGVDYVSGRDVVLESDASTSPEISFGVDAEYSFERIMREGNLGRTAPSEGQRATANGLIRDTSERSRCRVRR
jgi:hypothetical protein